MKRRAPEFETYGDDNLPYPLDDWPQLVHGINRLTPEVQRLWARWAVQAAIREAGMEGSPAVDEMLTGAATWSRKLDELSAGLDRRGDELADEEMNLECEGLIESFLLWQQQHALKGLRHLTHPDPRSAALGAAAAALGAAGCCRAKRNATTTPEIDMIIDFAYPAERVRATAEVLARATAAPPDEWSRLAGELPTPLTSDERLAAVEKDRRQYAWINEARPFSW